MESLESVSSSENWADFMEEEGIDITKDLEETVTDEETTGPTKLSRSAAGLYGFYPSLEGRVLNICRACKAVFYPQNAKNHECVIDKVTPPYSEYKKTPIASTVPTRSAQEMEFKQEKVEDPLLDTFSVPKKERKGENFWSVALSKSCKKHNKGRKRNTKGFTSEPNLSQTPTVSTAWNTTVLDAFNEAPSTIVRDTRDAVDVVYQKEIDVYPFKCTKQRKYEATNISVKRQKKRRKQKKFPKLILPPPSPMNDESYHIRDFDMVDQNNAGSAHTSSNISFQTETYNLPVSNDHKAYFSTSPEFASLDILDGQNSSSNISCETETYLGDVSSYGKTYYTTSLELTSLDILNGQNVSSNISCETETYTEPVSNYGHTYPASSPEFTYLDMIDEQNSSSNISSETESYLEAVSKYRGAFSITSPQCTNLDILDGENSSSNISCETETYFEAVNNYGATYSTTSPAFTSLDVSNGQNTSSNVPCETETYSEPASSSSSATLAGCSSLVILQGDNTFSNISCQTPCAEPVSNACKIYSTASTEFTSLGTLDGPNVEFVNPTDHTLSRTELDSQLVSINDEVYCVLTPQNTSYENIDLNAELPSTGLINETFTTQTHLELSNNDCGTYSAISVTGLPNFIQDLSYSYDNARPIEIEFIDLLQNHGENTLGHGSQEGIPLLNIEYVPVAHTESTENEHNYSERFISLPALPLGESQNPYVSAEIQGELPQVNVYENYLDADYIPTIQPLEFASEILMTTGDIDEEQYQLDQ